VEFHKYLTDVLETSQGVHDNTIQYELILKENFLHGRMNSTQLDQDEWIIHPDGSWIKSKYLN
jgi:hypothetical protein